MNPKITYTTINTHKGLFRYNRLPYGISSAPGIFQRTMENILQGMSRVIVRVDDILITGKNEMEHLGNLECVLEQLSKSGIRLNKSKCLFMSDEVIYLGHRVTKQGIHPVANKVEAITQAPPPTNVKELQSYLGMLNFYHRFLPNLSTVLAPLHKLLNKNEKWQWGKMQNKAWLDSKQLMTSSDLLIHFDTDKQMILSCDASPYGVGAVLSHQMVDESGQLCERPIGYASRTLTKSEKNYSQLEKEDLGRAFTRL